MEVPGSSIFRLEDGVVGFGCHFFDVRVLCMLDVYFIFRVGGGTNLQHHGGLDDTSDWWCLLCQLRNHGLHLSTV